MRIEERQIDELAGQNLSNTHLESIGGRGRRGWAKFGGGPRGLKQQCGSLVADGDELRGRRDGREFVRAGEKLVRNCAGGTNAQENLMATRVESRARCGCFPCQHAKPGDCDDRDLRGLSQPFHSAEADANAGKTARTVDGHNSRHIPQMDPRFAEKLLHRCNQGRRVAATFELDQAQDFDGTGAEPTKRDRAGVAAGVNSQQKLLISLKKLLSVWRG
jgi:hypothetical protein